jgi:virginiamycin B lyase
MTRRPRRGASGSFPVMHKRIRVDADDRVWLTDWSTNAIVRFDPATERFTSYPSDRRGANVRQMLGRAGEAWGAESGNDRLVRITTP